MQSKEIENLKLANPGNTCEWNDFFDYQIVLPKTTKISLGIFTALYDFLFF